ncbi:MAG: sugar transferase [Deltaproteobacteria bacterium]|nr:sugar transferase [Deltaproteobacteria bacterium]
MKILYIDQYYSNRRGNSGTRSHEFARRWVQGGHEVTIVTTASAYSHLAGQRRWLRRSVDDGISVWSLRIPYAQSMGYARRIWSFASFMVVSTVMGLLVPKPDVVFASSTPLTVGVTGAIVAWLRTRPFVFEVRDLWPRAPIELGAIRNRFIIAILEAVERWIYRRAVAINALSPGMAAGVVETGVDPARVSVISNACDFDLRRDPVFQATDDRRTIVYAGALGPANDVADLLGIAAELKRRGRGDIEFVIAGEGSRERSIRERIRDDDLTQFRMTGSLSRAEVGELLANASLAVTCFAPLPVLATNSPNKFFDYLACGVPQITNSPGWLCQLLEESGAGAYWPWGDATAGADLVESLIDHPTRRAVMRRAASELANRFERGRLAGELFNVLRDATRAEVRGWSIAWQGLFDRACALVGLALLSPLLAAVTWKIRREDGGPAFYRPERIGLGGRTFRMWKFRTMVVNAEASGLGLNVESSDPRITRIGTWLRKWSLDELPQLINVVTGDMRLVGPRPALPAHAERYTPEQRERLRVRPGLTGWAQVNGRNSLSWTKNLELDVWYARRRSFRLDLAILMRTLGVVIRREGLYENDAGLGDDFNRFSTSVHDPVTKDREKLP